MDKVIDVIIINGVKYVQYERSDGKKYWYNELFQ